MRGGFYVIGVLVFLALFGDLLANEKPYMMQMSGETYFPAFRNYLVAAGLAEWPKALVNIDYPTAEYQMAVFPPVPYLPNRIDLTQAYEKPSRRHLLGTDRLGRDVLSGIIHGARISISIGLVAMGIATAIGVAVGAIAGFFGGWVDMVINRIFELMISIPTFFLILSISAFVQSPSIFYIMIIIGLTSWVGIARFTRNEFLKVRNLDYVSAAIALGAPNGRIMFRSLLCS